MMPSLLDASGLSYPGEYKGRAIRPLQGESFLPGIREGEWSRQRPIYWEHEGNGAVRDGRWKLVRRHPQDWELYDMVEDRTETSDLSARDPDRASRMAASYDEWAERCEVQPWPLPPAK
jgi:arylsulfatase